MNNNQPVAEVVCWRSIRHAGVDPEVETNETHAPRGCAREYHVLFMKR